MMPSELVQCQSFPCLDTHRESYIVPNVEIDPDRVSIVLVSEVPPENPMDYYYAGEQGVFAQTTLLAFQDAGCKLDSFREIVDMGVYLTTAVKCGKTGYGVAAATVKNCSWLLEQELDLFPHVKAYLLMGDVAIKAVNEISRRNGSGRVIPASATYKIRGEKFSYREARALPSYVQAGPAFFVEKSKRRMIAQDIHQALVIAGKLGE